MSLIKSYCYLCKSITNNHYQLCRYCCTRLPWNNSACYYCSYPLQTINPLMRCGDCMINKKMIDHCQAPLLYTQPIKHVIAQIKFHKQLHFIKLLSQIFLKHIRYEQQHDIIIPVPLHKKRLAQRGFNQALELAQPISKKLNLPLKPDYCKRIINTKPQTTLKLKNRARNLNNAFICSDEVSNKRIILFDDVYTTGSTLESLALKLKQSGATYITAWCIARTIKNDLLNKDKSH